MQEIPIKKLTIGDLQCIQKVAKKGKIPPAIIDGDKKSLVFQG